MGRHLVVAIRGWTNAGGVGAFRDTGGEYPGETLRTLQESLPEARIWAPAFDLPMFSMADPEALAERLFADIDAEVKASPHVERVTLLGYSAGSLLARRVFCRAHGMASDGSFRHPPATWADKVGRLVMVAGITRGWEYSSAAPAHVRFLAPLLVGLARAVCACKRWLGRAEGQRPFIWQIHRGAPFVVSTRIQYVRLAQRLRAEGREVPATVFLLGARDEFISPADCTELGPRAEFAFIELPGANHTEALRIAGDGPGPKGRRERLVAAIDEPLDALHRRDWLVPPEDIDDYLDPMDLCREDVDASTAAADVEHVVLIVHGIRDDGFWTKRVAREIKSQARRRGISVRAPSPSYGYFSMWDFVRPGGRERAAHWFLERYADICSHFPHARVSFVGHSNGTYIAARALALCAAVRLHRVVFAGSVVRRDYDWARLGGRVDAVLNYVGSRDSVVALLPGAMERLGLRSIGVGGAGVDGFVLPPEEGDVPVLQLRFAQGGHDAAIKEGYWTEIADFVLSDAPPTLPRRAPVDRSRFFRAVFGVAPIVFVLLGLVAGAAVLSPLVAVVVTLFELRPMSAIQGLGAIIGTAFLAWLAWRVLKSW